MSPANSTLLLLRNNNLTDGTTGWKGVYEIMPDEMDQVVALYDTDPQQDGRGMRDPYPIFQHPGVTVMVRSRNYSAGWTQIQSIVSFLQSVVNITDFTIGTNGTTFGMYKLDVGPAPAGREKNNQRCFFVARYITLITEL